MPKTRKVDPLSSLFEDMVFTAPWPGPRNSEAPVDPDSWGATEDEAAVPPAPAAPVEEPPAS